MPDPDGDFDLSYSAIFLLNELSFLISSSFVIDGGDLSYIGEGKRAFF